MEKLYARLEKSYFESIQANEQAITMYIISLSNAEREILKQKLNIIVMPGIVNENQNTVISPVSTGDYRVVLTWGASPSDLDSHMTGNTISRSYDHIYYDRKTGYTGNLDADDTTSYGPETITITGFYKLQDGFAYSVRDYSNKSSSTSSAMSNSGATVALYKGDDLIETYHIPTNKIGTVWRVFSIDANGNIRNLNEFYNQSNSSLVD